jgi:hypothetical protein
MRRFNVLCLVSLGCLFFTLALIPPLVRGYL